MNIKERIKQLLSGSSSLEIRVQRLNEWSSLNRRTEKALEERMEAVEKRLVEIEALKSPN